VSNLEIRDLHVSVGKSASVLVVGSLPHEKDA